MASARYSAGICYRDGDRLVAQARTELAAEEDSAAIEEALEWSLSIPKGTGRPRWLQVFVNGAPFHSQQVSTAVYAVE